MFEVNENYGPLALAFESLWQKQSYIRRTERNPFHLSEKDACSIKTNFFGCFWKKLTIIKTSSKQISTKNIIRETENLRLLIFLIHKKLKKSFQIQQNAKYSSCGIQCKTVAQYNSIYQI